MYRKAITEAGQQQANLVQQMAEVQNQMVGLSVTNSEYQRLKGVLEGLEDEYDALIESVDSWSQAIRDIPLNSAIAAMDDYKKHLDTVIEGQDNLVNLFGYTLTEEDYQERAKGYERLAQDAYNIAQSYAHRMAGAKNGSDDYKTNLQYYEQYMAQYRNYKFLQENEAAINAAKVPITLLENEMKTIQNNTQSLQNEINNLVEDGLTGTVNQYEALIKYNDEQLDNIKNQRKEYEIFRQTLIGLMGDEVSTENNPVLQAIDDAFLQLDQLERTANKSNLESSLMINGGIDLANLQNTYEVLQQENTKLSDAISLQESRGTTIYADTYRQMADNITDQIQNLMESNALLEQQNNTVGITAAKYRENQELIESQNSQISQLNMALEDNNYKLANYASNYITSLKDTISTAISESASETGLTDATMKALTGQFEQLKELANVDISTAFQKTAQGIKVNANEMKKLVDI